jgi:hypothetical protein
VACPECVDLNAQLEHKQPDKSISLHCVVEHVSIELTVHAVQPSMPAAMKKSLTRMSADIGGLLQNIICTGYLWEASEGGHTRTCNQLASPWTQGCGMQVASQVQVMQCHLERLWCIVCNVGCCNTKAPRSQHEQRR